MSIKNAFFFWVIAALALARPAAALECVVTANIDGDSWNPDEGPVGGNECETDQEIEFQVSGGSNGDKLEVVEGNDCGERNQDNDCHTIEAEVELKGAVAQSFPFGLKTILRDQACDSVGERTVYVWFRPLSGSDETNSFTDSERAECVFEVDTRRPEVITGVKGGEGETTIEVTWDRPADSDDLREIHVYHQPVDGECPGDSDFCRIAPWLCDAAADAQDEDDAGTEEDVSVEPDASVIDGGADTPDSSAWETVADAVDDLPELEDLMAGLPHKSEPGTANGTELTNAVEVGQQAAVVVVAEDRAGNTSVPSQVTCIQGVQTIGFCDLNEEQGGSCKSGCSVGTMDASEPTWFWPIALALVALVALALSARRRKA